MIIPEPIKIKVELMSDEIEYILEELHHASHDIFIFLNYQKIVDKLKQAHNKAYDKHKY